MTGDRVCILAQNAFAYMELYAACARLGAIACPINWRLSTEEIGFVISLVDPQMMVVEEAYLPQLKGLDLSKLKAAAIFGAEAMSGFSPLPEFYRSADDNFDEVASDDPFVILSTAAVAGVPRGAVLTHQNIIMAGYQLIGALGLTPEDRHLAALPLFHVTGFGLSMAVLQTGGANVIMETLDPALASQLIDQHRVTLLADFPPVLAMLLEARQATGAHWESLRFVLGLDSPEVIQQLHSQTGAEFWTGFGQSETSGVVTLTAVKEKPGSAGRPLPAARVRCVNTQDEAVGAGEEGEIVVQGPLVFDGYWRDPDATDYAFRGGWHHTGDLGKFDSEGYLYYLGRKPEKELIKSGGENIYPAEVERIILELPEVNAVCVIGVSDPTWGEAVKAVVELVPGETLTANEIAKAVAERIASYKKPRYVDFVDALPRNDQGEIDRQGVKAAHS
jgi:long-chain acyl-CoA synthetase